MRPLGHDDEWRDIYRRITLCYVDEESGDYYLTETHDQPRALIGVALESAKGHDLAYAGRRRTLQRHLGHTLLRAGLQNARASCIRRR